MTGVLASLIEAYGELRVNKGRIMLSLIAVAVSVFVLTGVLGGGTMVASALQQESETWMGRPAQIEVQPRHDGGQNVTPEDESREVLAAMNRFGMQRRTRMMHSFLRVQTTQGAVEVETTIVDPDYRSMFRVQIGQGRWIADSDGNRLTPAIVVNEALYQALGQPELGREAVTLWGSHWDGKANESAEAIVVGVIQDSGSMGAEYQLFTPAQSALHLPGMTKENMFFSYRAWVKPEDAGAAESALATALSSTPAGSFDVHTMVRGDEIDILNTLKWVISAIAGGVLLLGAMGLVNISLVTVRYRVREIGIRRSYGATSGRIFFGVLMESVVATVVAGAVGVMAAVALLKSPVVTGWLARTGLVEVPPFPVSAVIVGMTAATLVGILAGALPALIATQIKVIDAIRS